MDLAKYKKEIVKIEATKSDRTIQGEKQYLARFLNKFVDTYGEPNKFDMSDEAMLYYLAMETYKFLNRNY